MLNANCRSNFKWYTAAYDYFCATLTCISPRLVQRQNARLARRRRRIDAIVWGVWLFALQMQACFKEELSISIFFHQWIITCLLRRAQSGEPGSTPGPRILFSCTKVVQVGIQHPHQTIEITYKIFPNLQETQTGRVELEWHRPKLFKAYIFTV